MVELTQLKLYMEEEEMTPRSSSLKSGRDEEEEYAKHMRKERKAGRSKVEKALVAAQTQSASASPARSETDDLQGAYLPLPLGLVFSFFLF